MSDTNLMMFVQEKMYNRACTPDLNHIQRKFSYVPLFVYGPEKHGFSLSNNFFYNQGYRIGVGLTYKPNFVLYIQRSSGLPAAFEDVSGDVSGRLQGEIWMVPPSTLCDFDDDYQNGGRFDRRRVNVAHYHPDEKDKKEKNLHITPAWIYLADADMWCQDFDRKDMHLCEMFQNASSTFYYQYMRKQDKNVAMRNL